MYEETIDLRDIWLILKNKFKLIIIFSLVIGILSGISTMVLYKPEYKATASIFINKESIEEGGQDLQDVNFYQKLVKDYSKIANSKKVLNDVTEKLDIDFNEKAIAGMLSVTSEENSQFINLTVTNSSEELTYKIANQVAESTKLIGQEIRGEDLVQIVDDAKLSTTKNSPKLKQNLLIGFILGLMISIFYVFLREFLENSIKSEKIITEELGLNVLGVLPVNK